ncbi:MAG: arsenate reductase (glutaredoxin) [Bacteroidetes bacterium]|nr:MAG: arsenate reductase (glutaredoxin) [Bacteroidota bacterium]
MYKIYHNPRCKKSRAGLQYLESKSVEFEIIKYLNDTFTLEELTVIFAKLNLKPSEMIRKQEAIYKSDFKNKTFTDEEWIRIFVQHPKLINRPIVESKHKAVWADPPENIDELL